MNQEKKINLFWEFLYLHILTIIVCSIPFMTYQFSTIVMLSFLLVIIIGISILRKKELSKRLLYMNNIINLFAPNVIAYFILFYIAKSKEFIFGYIVAVAAMDVFSFTKAGKQSLNRKLIGNTNSLARLSICLPVPRKPGLQPIIGVGDILYYTIITMFCIYSKNVTAGLYAAIIVLIGQLVNTVSTSILIRVQKEHYKGFPATLFPGLFIFIVGITGKVF